MDNLGVISSGNSLIDIYKLTRHRSIVPSNNANAFVSPGFSLTIQGTSVARAVSSTNSLTRLPRVGTVSTSTSGNVCGIREAGVGVLGGNGTAGGYILSFSFGISDTTALVTSARMFIGLQSNVNTPTNVEANTLTQCVGIGQLSSDSTQLYVFSGAASANTAIGLGATNFPLNITSAFNFTVICTKAGAMSYVATNLGTGVTATGTIATPPSNTTALGLNSYRTNNAIPAVAGFDMGNLVLVAF